MAECVQPRHPVVQDPLLGCRNQLFLALDNRINQPRAQGLFGGHALTLNNVLVGRHEPHEIHRFHVTAASRQQTQCHLGKAELDTAMIPGNAVVT